MLSHIINYSIQNKFLVLLVVAGLIVTGTYAYLNIPIGAVPDITNNQVQVITTSRDLSTQDVELFLTYPVELEMANLPGVKEIRSISKFGLSVVTIIFDDNMGTYLPRQLIAEKLKVVQERIPEGFGSPTMGPISTGLGEIYQYILDVDPAYAERYDVAQLRTIQDWIVKRQLSGIPGVVEVNTWGGYLKTYEVAIDPYRLKANGISLTQVFRALEENNSVAGGGYIEKTNETFFIRAEGLVENVADIEQIVVAQQSGSPIYVRDIATVGFGAATRFGAITGNGEGEKVLGQIMMLKGANSNAVIEAVKERVNEVQGSLPPGVFINPFLERSDLIERTTATITENLIFGFLIVLFVVVFLLGNLRSGLVVASVIPLTLLFALSMMYFFGVDANLMSLGAIDFGIIIDGAVIIVEYIAFQVSKNSGDLLGLNHTERANQLNTIATNGAKKMMHSAIFGQVIIIIVFIPILSLSGVEGKMFRPMALTFCFALIGAMILCFTYVPVMASLFLKPQVNKGKNISARFIDWIKSIYTPALRLALRFRGFVIGFALVLLVLTGYLFSRMGGEFVPTLDEGDFVIQPVLKTGMSLAETVRMTTRMEQIVRRFPEVRQVVSRIGAAEVPTDPMSMEESDVIITLNKKASWTSADSKDELANVLKEAIVAEIPGVEIEFTQPIEMRFNELITGVRADLAIKLFGEDLNILYQKALAIQKAISQVEGAADITVEKIDGLPQMSVRYDREKIARFGLNVADLNAVVATGFAGKSAGTIFEGERQFDLVLRYDAKHRQSIEHLREALVELPDGRQLPLETFATIELTEGPAKISRDDTKRRVVVGVNVRGRDLQSVVDDVQQIITKNIQLPAGYYIQYGGQFENLQEASSRLMIAVPVALLLIFILLYFAFNSTREALLIFSAIPLATIGGVLALYLRDMPFSISAGVGFIALFGIAVLNGIVLIEHFKDLKRNGMNDIEERVITGASDRIRPVLLTAIAAALGFLPMAVSTSAGAEVQQPLATVVIGGLISATFLTLFILPLLYRIFDRPISVSNAGKNTVILLLLISPWTLNSQETLTLDEIVQLSLAQNPEVRTAQLAAERERILIDATDIIPKTDFYYQYDANNVAENGDPLHVFGLGQSFLSPGVQRSNKALQQSVASTQEKETAMLVFELRRSVHRLYDQIQYHQERLAIHQQLDSIYQSYQSRAEQKYQLGESTIIEKMSIQQKRNAAKLQVFETEETLAQLYHQMKILVPIDTDFRIARTDYQQLTSETFEPTEHPMVQYNYSLVEQAQKRAQVNAQQKLPEWNIGLFGGFNSASGKTFYPGVEAGLALSLFQGRYRVLAQADAVQTEAQSLRAEHSREILRLRQDQLVDQRQSIDQRIKIFNQEIIQTSEQLLASATLALNRNEIDYFQYLTILEDTRQARLQFIELIHTYNQTNISIQFLN